MASRQASAARCCNAARNCSFQTTYSFVRIQCSCCPLRFILLMQCARCAGRQIPCEWRISFRFCFPMNGHMHRHSLPFFWNDERISNHHISEWIFGTSSIRTWNWDSFFNLVFHFSLLFVIGYYSPSLSGSKPSRNLLCPQIPAASTTTYKTKQAAVSISAPMRLVG